MSVHDEVLAANEEYASSFTQGDLALPPARGFAILTCMDARLDPAKYAGLAEGDAHVIRNAGGRARSPWVKEEAYSSLAASTSSRTLMGTPGDGGREFTKSRDLVIKTSAVRGVRPASGAG